MDEFYRVFGMLVCFELVTVATIAVLATLFVQISEGFPFFKKLIARFMGTNERKVN